MHKFRSSLSQDVFPLHWFKRRLYNVLKVESFLRTALIVLLGPRRQTSVWSDGSWLSSASSFFFFLHSLQDTSVPKRLHNQPFDCDSRVMTMSIPAHTADGTFIHTSHITLHDTVKQHTVYSGIAAQSKQFNSRIIVWSTWVRVRRSAVTGVSWQLYPLFTLEGGDSVFLPYLENWKFSPNICKRTCFLSICCCIF